MAGPPFRLALVRPQAVPIGERSDRTAGGAPPAWCHRATRTTTNPDHMGRRRRRRRFRGRCADASSPMRYSARNRPARVCVQPDMTDYTDLELMTDDTAAELSLMHLNGIPCPDDDRARALYAALDEVDQSAANPRRHPAKQSDTGFGPRVITRVLAGADRVRPGTWARRWRLASGWYRAGGELSQQRRPLTARRGPIGRPGSSRSPPPAVDGVATPATIRASGCAVSTQGDRTGNYRKSPDRAENDRWYSVPHWMSRLNDFA